MKYTRLFQKIIVRFIFFVLLPFIIILVLFLQRSTKLQLENDIAQAEKLSVQIVNTLRRQIELAENMCKAVVQNQNLTTFLEMPYDSKSDLSYYRTTIRDFVKVTNGVSDVKLRLYLENKTIPLGFGIFYPINDISSISDFNSFYSSDKDYIWVDNSFYTNSLIDKRIRNNQAYHYFHKIKVGTRLLGVIEAIVPEKMFSISDSLSSNELEPTKLSGFYFYNFSNQTFSLEETSAFVLGPPISSTSSTVCLKKDLYNGPFNIIVVTSRSHDNRINVSMAFLVVTLITIMIIGFFSYNRKMISDINVCLDGMEIAISNNFELPNSVKMKVYDKIMHRNDEISILAKRINFLISQINMLLLQKIQQQTAAKEQQLLVLQHQINPHFLYNTMEVFSSRMELAGLYEESDAISAFCRMLRYSMNTEDLKTKLKDEIQQVKYYIAIQKLSGIPFDVRFDIPDSLLDSPVIRFLLEPFIENSFKYRGNASPLIIFISASEKDSCIEIKIKNNGEPVSQQRLLELNERFQNAPAYMKTSGEHIGLSNINSRLKLYYGDNHFIHVECKDNYTIFSFIIENKSNFN